ncbi:MAG: methionine--tRNA ligase subunit beta [Candidatus Omnitrophica bacterium]|nr:methionine--tRNA ligase subunit beta [Candidatus Omnitrophota bacterium]
MVSFQDFKKMDIRIAVIKDVKDHPNADKLFIVNCDTGTEEKQVVAGIKDSYKPEELIGKKVVVITNLEPATIRGVESHAMILAAKDDNTLSVLVPEKEIKTGTKIS